MAGETADALRDALEKLSEDLDTLINSMPEGPDKVALEQVQDKLENAAGDVDALSMETLLTNNADLQTIKDLTTKINANSSAIASSVANVKKITGIGDAAANLDTAVKAGNVGGIVSAAASLKAAL